LSKTLTYDSVNQSFEKAVIKLQENLQYLADKGSVNDSFISIQNSIIKALINYQHQTEKIISALEWEITELVKGKVNEIEQLKKTKESLEAICIIHGIINFPMWMQKGNKYLVREAVSNTTENTTTIPELLQEKFSQLPKEEKELLAKILYKSYDDEITAIEMQIAELKQKIK